MKTTIKSGCEPSDYAKGNFIVDLAHDNTVFRNPLGIRLRLFLHDHDGDNLGEIVSRLTFYEAHDLIRKITEAIGDNK